MHAPMLQFNAADNVRPSEHPSRVRPWQLGTPQPVAAFHPQVNWTPSQKFKAPAHQLVPLLVLNQPLPCGPHHRQKIAKVRLLLLVQRRLHLTGRQRHGAHVCRLVAACSGVSAIGNVRLLLLAPINLGMDRQVQLCCLKITNGARTPTQPLCASQGPRTCCCCVAFRRIWCCSCAAVLSASAASAAASSCSSSWRLQGGGHPRSEKNEHQEG